MCNIIRKEVGFKCYTCSGKGRIVKFYANKPYHRNIFICEVCGGTGIYKESHYYFINPKTKECYDGDTLK